MPKETFLRLEKDKKQKIEQALFHEFSRVTFEKASISNIIEEAQIPRGSFYQYFEDKEDAIEYIIQKFSNQEKKQIETFLKENGGDIFKTSLSIFDYVIEKVEKQEETQLCKNILEELKRRNSNAFEKHNHKNFEKSLWINQEELKIEEEEDLNYIMKILTMTTRTATIEVVSKRVSKEKGRKGLIKQIEILKRGMAK